MKIMNFLSLWLKEIVLVFIFISIVELILPNGNMKRYINMIIGFLIIIVIIGPFVKLFHTDYSFARNLYKNQIESINFDQNHNSDLNRIQNEQIKDFYISKVKNEIQDLIISTTDYSIEEIEVFIKEEEKNYGELEEIKLILKDNLNFQDQEQIKVKEVAKISVGENRGDVVKYEELHDERIKMKIVEAYNLPMEKIKILINQEGKVD